MTRHSSVRTIGPFLLAWILCCAELRGQELSPDAGPANDEQPLDEVIFQDTIDTGFIFFDSGYISPPYLVEATGNSVTVNGHALTLTSSFLDRTPDDDNSVRPRRGLGRERGEFGRFSGRKRGFRDVPDNASGATRRAASRIADSLHGEAAIVAFPDRTPVFLELPSDQYDFFRALLNPVPSSDALRAFLESRGNKAEQDLWESWISRLTVTEGLRARVEPIIESVADVEARTISAIRANQRLHTLAYPLTVLGMVLGVLALGHLLKSFSKMDTAQEDNLLPPDVLRATAVSLGLMVILSLFDLTWTILASQAGQMRELNPLGSQLISDPSLLIAFKLMATLLGCGILFVLRRHQRARQACWWLCLVCTVLTFRWVMFNSMFVA